MIVHTSFIHLCGGHANEHVSSPVELVQGILCGERVGIKPLTELQKVLHPLPGVTRRLSGEPGKKGGKEGGNTVTLLKQSCLRV